MNAKKVTLLLASTLTVMSGATIAASLPLIRDAFADQENVEFLSRLVLTVPALLIAIFSPVAGYLVDRWGRKKLLLASLLFYVIGGVAGGLVSDLYLMLVSRGLLGIAVAFVMTATTTLIADYYDGEERSAFLGQQAAAMSIGGIIFISLGGWLAELSWRAPFGVYGLALLMIPLAWSVLQEPTVDRTTTSSKAPTLSGSSRMVIVFLYALLFVTMVVFYMIPVQIPFVLTTDLKASSSQVGIAVATATLAGAIVSLNFQRIRAWLHPAWIFAVAFLSLGAGYVMIYLADSYYAMVLSLFVGGLGVGLIMPNTNFLIMNIAPPQTRGRLLGGLSTFLFLGQFFSPIIVTPLAQTYTMKTAFLLAGLLTLVTAIGFVFYIVSSPKQALIKQSA